MDLDTVERRSELRFDIGNEVALVDFLDGREPVTCCIWNVSASGACLFVTPNLVMPTRFKVILENMSLTAVEAWRERSHVGIKFIDHAEKEEPTKS